MQPRKAVPKRASRILELADGSEDDDDDDDNMPGLEADEDTDDEDSDDDDVEVPAESAEAELSTCPIPVKDIKLTINVERLSKEWTSPVYAFFKPTPLIEYIKDRRVHVFECNAKHCKGKGNGWMVRRYLDTSDAKSTSNLCKHAKICWGEDEVAAADQTQDANTAREALKKNRDGSITEAFE